MNNRYSGKVSAAEAVQRNNMRDWPSLWDDTEWRPGGGTGSTRRGRHAGAKDAPASGADALRCKQDETAAERARLLSSVNLAYGILHVSEETAPARDLRPVGDEESASEPEPGPTSGDVLRFGIEFAERIAYTLNADPVSLCAVRRTLDKASGAYLARQTVGRGQLVGYVQDLFNKLDILDEKGYIGDAAGQYPPAAASSLDAAIRAVRQVALDGSSDETERREALGRLVAADVRFTDAKIAPAAGELIAMLDEVESLLSDWGEAAEVPDETMEALRTAMHDAGREARRRLTYSAYQAVKHIVYEQLSRVESYRLLAELLAKAEALLGEAAQAAPAVMESAAGRSLAAAHGEALLVYVEGNASSDELANASGLLSESLDGMAAAMSGGREPGE